MDTSKQLKKGVVSILVLEMIRQKDQYGYELIQAMDEASDGYYLLKEGSLYPVFYRLEDQGLIESYKLEVGKRKVGRKYYRITDKGIDKLNEMKTEWATFVKKTEMIIGRSK